MTLRDFKADKIWFMTEDGKASGYEIELDPPPFTGVPDEWFKLIGNATEEHWSWNGDDVPRSWEGVRITKMVAVRDNTLDSI